jgi:hypothetical protein
MWRYHEELTVFLALEEEACCGMCSTEPAVMELASPLPTARRAAH